MIKLYHFLILTLFFSYVPTTATLASILDRSVIAIDRDSFTQVEIIENTILKKSIAEQKNRYSTAKEIKENWESTIIDFLNDQLLFMESKRSGNFKPLDNIVKNKYSELKKQGFNSKKINLRKAIIRYLQIENFKKIKKASSSNSYENMSWFKQIKRKYTIRYFKNARKYVELNTFRVRDQN